MKIVTEKYDRYGAFTETTVTKLVSDDDARYDPKNLGTRHTHCHMCGNPLDVFDLNADLGLTEMVGYGSAHDGELIHIQFCCSCFDRLVNSCKLSPVISGGDEEDDE